MDCEVCGKSIQDKPCRAVIENAKLLVCNKCAQHSSSSWRFETEQQIIKQNFTTQPLIQRKKVMSNIQEGLQLIENYGQIIKIARRNLNFTHNDLGKKIREKVSVLQKLETQKLTPNKTLIQKLEDTLKIKILRPYKPIPVAKGILVKKSYEPTFGDVAVLRKEKRS